MDREKVFLRLQCRSRRAVNCFLKSSPWTRPKSSF